MARTDLAPAPRQVMATVAVTLLSCALMACSHVQPWCPQGECRTSVLSENVASRLIFIGDAGAAKPGGWIGQSIKKLPGEPENSLVIFLGDNVYEDGYEGDETSKYLLDAQVKMAGGANVLFIPGNHDWRAKSEGINAAKIYLEEEHKGRVRYWPTPGCVIHPEKLEVGDFSIIAIDTERWLSKEKDNWWKKCSDWERDLEFLLVEADTKHHIVVAHHPLVSDGTHGGWYDWRQHIFPLTEINSALWIPLPVFGSLYPLGRKMLKVRQDLASSEYENLIEDLTRVLSKNPPLVFASGHDHSIQIHRLYSDNNGTYLHILSGSGSKLTSVRDSEDTLFAQLKPGYVVLDQLHDGRIVVHVHSQADGKKQKNEVVFVMPLAEE